MKKNLILMSDSYKYSHHKQYPRKVTYMHSYLESRGGRYGEVKFFGLQYIIEEYLSQAITMEDLNEAKEVITLHGLDFDYEGWEYIVKEHDGYLPIKIRSVKEGEVVPNNNVLVTIESTDEKVPWVVGFVETLLLKVWYPTTVCTQSYAINKIIAKFMDETCDTNEKLPFMLHDFGYRGASSEESASIGGLAHLVNFKGSDNLGAIMLGRKYYEEPMAGYSIPASEHSTMTSWGKNHEVDAYRNMIQQFGNGDLFACVSDSWNFFNAVDKLWGEELKKEVEAMNAQLVIRPDSGDPITNILYALTSLEHNFGVTINQKGYKTLKNVALIQGDGVSEEAIYDILNAMKACGFAAENIAFGMGGALLQGNQASSINRDTHRFAIKCSAIKFGDELQEVYKSPITDKGKVSKRGRLDLIKTNGAYETVTINDYVMDTYHEDSVMQVVFCNGKQYNKEKMAAISNRG